MSYIHTYQFVELYSTRVWVYLHHLISISLFVLRCSLRSLGVLRSRLGGERARSETVMPRRTEAAIRRKRFRCFDTRVGITYRGPGARTGHVRSEASAPNLALKIRVTTAIPDGLAACGENPPDLYSTYGGPSAHLHVHYSRCVY
jgi:hypothetical protein